jgi:hypothetical protein
LIYISTNEAREKFLAFTETSSTMSSFEIVFFGDFFGQVDIPIDMGEPTPNQIGMVEQIICANAHTFIGMPLSTFSGYITRMRG